MNALLQTGKSEKIPWPGMPHLPGKDRMCYYEQRGKMPRLQGRARCPAYRVDRTCELNAPRGKGRSLDGRGDPAPTDKTMDFQLAT